jgi:ATP-binding cassette subfamily F protein 3
MSLIVVKNLSLSFDKKIIFDKVGVQINKGDRIGLVGANGMGKTTLLRILVGDVFGNEGEITRTKGIRLGYLPQDITKISKGTLLASVLNAIPGKVEKERQLKEIEIDMAQEEDSERQTVLAQKAADLHYEIDYYNLQFSPHRAEQILIGLGFSSESFDTPVKELSGGWKMRASLAGILFQNPDILLLDEPTNHLDIPSVLWLENFLSRFNHSLILICHDRNFLNSQINCVISIEPDGFHVYKGNYDGYIKSRQEEEKVLTARARNQEQKVKEAKRFIERFRAKSSKARQAQSKIKMLQKEEIVKTYKKQKQINFTFPKVPRSGDNVLLIEEVGKSFGNDCLYQDVTLSVRRGERIAVIGKNGVGKTTLLKIIAEEIMPDRGVINFGHNVTMSYYAQHHAESLNDNNTILEEISNVVPDAGIGFVRSMCGAFLFSGDDVEKTIGVLSGGERARVALACILVKPGNLMLMDEPTNHLDIISSGILAEALKNYNGTLIFVSHNQWLIHQLSTKIWDISEKKLEEYPGNLEDYIYHLNQNMPIFDAGEEKGNKKETKKKNNHSRESAKERRKREAGHRDTISREIKPIKNELTWIEERIDELEKREITLARELADPEIYKDIQKSMPRMDEYNEVKNEMEKLLKRWESQQESLKATQDKLQL